MGSSLAKSRHGKPEIINPDQGLQYTSFVSISYGKGKHKNIIGREMWGIIG